MIRRTGPILDTPSGGKQLNFGGVKRYGWTRRDSGWDEGEIANALLDSLSSSAIAGAQNEPALFGRYYKKFAFF